MEGEGGRDGEHTPSSWGDGKSPLCALAATRTARTARIEDVSCLAPHLSSGDYLLTPLI